MAWSGAAQHGDGGEKMTGGTKQGQHLGDLLGGKERKLREEGEEVGNGAKRAAGDGGLCRWRWRAATRGGIPLADSCLCIKEKREKKLLPGEERKDSPRRRCPVGDPPRYQKKPYHLWIKLDISPPSKRTAVAKNSQERRGLVAVKQKEEERERRREEEERREKRGALRRRRCSGNPRQHPVKANLVPDRTTSTSQTFTGVENVEKR